MAKDEDAFNDVDAGAFIGREPEISRSEIPTDADLTAPKMPDPGWQKPPEGHRQATNVDDDERKRKV